MRIKSWAHSFVLGVALLLAIAQLHHILLFFSATLSANIDAAFGVTTGHPHWRVYQNRVLGPYLIKGLASMLSGDFTDAYLVLLVVTLALAGYQAWRIGEKIGGVRTGWFALITLHLLFMLMFSRSWLYIWDFIGLNVFLAFVELVLSKRLWYWFAALFAVAILNRESGQFIALWMMLEPVCRWLVRRSLTGKPDLHMLISGAACAVVGAWLINYLRTTLLVEEVGFNLIGGTPPGYGLNFFWALPGNFHVLLHAWNGGFISNLSIIIAMIFFSAIAGLSIALMLKDTLRYLAFSITIMTMALSILLFGYISETRVFIETIPILLMGACLLFQSSTVPE